MEITGDNNFMIQQEMGWFLVCYREWDNFDFLLN